MSHSSMDQAQMSGKIHALTSLRFFAALYVVCYHTLHISSFLPGLTTGVPNKFLSLGYISVSFFFLLSGYILSMVYLRKGTPLRLRSFYLARFARIYPLYLLTTIGDTPNLLLPRIAKYGIQMAWLKTLVTFLGNLIMLQAIVLWLRASIIRAGRSPWKLSFI